MDKREGGMRWAAVGRKRGGARRLLPPRLKNVLGRAASTTKKMDRLSRRKGREGGRKGGGEGEGRILFGRRSTKKGKRICFARGQEKKKGGKQGRRPGGRRRYQVTPSGQKAEEEGEKGGRP